MSAHKSLPKWGVLTLIVSIALLVIAGSVYVIWKNAVPTVEVNYLEVGQGDSILIRTSDRKVVLIDGSYPNGQALAQLQQRHIRHIDLIIVTHPDDDHTGGIAGVLRTIPVDKLITNGQPLNSPTYDEFERAIQESGVKHEVVKEGAMLPIGRLTLEVLSPRSITPDSVNNNSLVIRLLVGKIRFLFMGDAPMDEEQFLLHSGAPLYAQILKVGHHAANTSSSSEFIRRVSPTVAIYFAETGNVHGFPHQVTLDTLKSVGAKIYGTDVNGTITITTDGKSYTASTERGVPR